jgi:PKD repeat protein
MFEGPCIRGAKDKGCLSGDQAYVEPHHYYLHTELEEGGCVVGSAFVPSDSGWPDKYQFLFIDFIFETIYNLIEAPEKECRGCMPPIPGYINETFYQHEVMVDIFFGPYKDGQALYVISRGPGQSIRRIRYTGNENVAPVANFTVTDTADVNEMLVFDGSGSFDGDGDAITFLWDFGDGGESTQRTANHTYKEYGQYTVKLTVTDTLGQTNQVQDTIQVGIPPIATMYSPKLDSRFAVGQELTVFGNATNALGVLLNDSQISWEVRQHHSEHYHPFLDRQSGTGNNFKLDPAPSPEDFKAAANSYLEIIMYATDSYGLVTNVSRNIYPKKVFITIDSIPRGLEVFVDEYPVTTPSNITSWENHKLRLNVLDQNNLTFASWSIGGARKTNYTVPARNITNPTISVTFAGNVSTAAPSSSPSDTTFFTPVFLNPTQQSPTTRTPTKKPLQSPTNKTPTSKPILATKVPSDSSILETDEPPVPSGSPIQSPSTDNSIDFLPPSSSTTSFRHDLQLVELCVLLFFNILL